MNVRRAGSIRSKLNAILVATTAAALLVAASALLVVDLRRQLADIEQDITTQADIVALASAPALAFADRKVGAENLAALRAKAGVKAAALYDERGALFATYRNGDAEVPFPSVVGSPGVRVEGDWAVGWRPVLSNGDRVGTVYLQVRHERLQQTLKFVGVLAIIMAGSLAAALMLSNRLQRALVQPILEVGEVARHILRGETSNLRARKTSDDEVGDLVDAFNAMLDELGRRSSTLEAANDALRASDERYQLAVRGSSAGLWDWDLARGITFYSPRFKQLLGYGADEFPDVPESIGRILHPDDRRHVSGTLRAHLRQRAPYQVECRLRDKEGNWRWFFVAGAALWNEAGKPFRMAGSVVEVTERKQAEQVLQDSNRAKDEFLATLAHELRNPLAPIRTGLEILRKDRANGPASERARATMERQLAHMIRLIDDLLDISRINSGKIRLELARISLRPVVESAIEISRPTLQAGRHELALDLGDEDIEIVGDPTRIAQALGNLLNNAGKYTPAAGRIAVRMRREGSFAVLVVEDNGEGIPADMLEGVFSLFAQVRSSVDRTQGGLGIGLFLVRNLVALHGGTVTAASPGPGRGSSFTVRLPCLPALSDPARQQGTPDSDVPVAGLKILVVDDNVDAAETLATVLEMGGSPTRVVHDGRAVLQEALDFGPDVVLLDIGLPGLTGYEVAEQLRREARFRNTLLVAITGWGAEQDKLRARQAGFDFHLTKPVDVVALQRLLAQATMTSTAAVTDKAGSGV